MSFNDDKIKKFLTELGKLTIKYDIEIAGCGECWLQELRERDHWPEPGKFYIVDKGGDFLYWGYVYDEDTQIAGDE